MHYSAKGKKAKKSQSASNHNNRDSASDTESNEEDELEISDSDHKEQDIDHSNTAYLPRNWTNEDVQRLRDLKARGLSNKEIGKKLHRSCSAVWNKWDHFNRKKLQISSCAMSLH